MKIAFVGAGAWGTALAVAAAPRHEVALWARQHAHVQAMQQAGENTRYLPGVALPANLQLHCADAQADAAQSAPAFATASDLIVLATPIAGLREWLTRLRGAHCPVVWLCKGFEAPVAQPFGLLAHEIQTLVAPDLTAGVLSGPSFAQEVARGQPTALVAASAHAAVRELLVQAFHGGHLRIYGNDDVAGVEVGGAVKNVLAIATGLCDGLGLGLNARAALITRGLAEMARLGAALGAKPETFMGLSGLGDLVLTATGDLSRNRRVGLLLAQGHGLAQALAQLGHVAEGVYCARTVAQRAARLGVDMPIANGVVALLDGQISPQQAMQALMQRDARPENAVN
ncbi:MAG: NAD(P)H-dependent glycerol-3-phosphate dehydrogenase [Burkholderiales bacterium]